MPRKITIPETTTCCRSIEHEEIETQPKKPLVTHTDVKPKRQITEAQREHLNKIRELAMQKKKELKEITLKSKLAKTVPKQELAAQYDNFTAQKATQKPVKPKPRVDPEPESESGGEVVAKKSKPKKKAKKSVYESDSEEVIVRKKKQPPLENLVYNTTKDQLYHRMIEERVRSSMMGYGNSLGV